MSVKVAEGVVEITADTKGVGRKIASDLDNEGGAVEDAGKRSGGRIAGGIVAGFAAVGGIAAVSSWFAGAVTGASDLNETVNKSRTIFGDYFSRVDEWTNRSATTLGLSKEAALATTTSFGDMFSQLGFAGQEAADFSRSVVQMSADLGSFNNLPTADVTDRISAAFRGEYDSLQALIPNISAARVEQEAMSLGLVETTVNLDVLRQKQTAAEIAQIKYNEAIKKHGAESTQAMSAGLALEKANAAVAKAAEGSKGEITAQAKAQAVLSILQKDGAAAMGDFARTSDGAANAGKIATAMMEDQQAKLGQQLLPAWSALLGFLTGTAIPAFGDLVTWIGENTETVLILGGTILGAAVSYGIITTAMKAHRAFMIASAAATGGLTVVQWALNAAMSANPIGLIVTALALLVGGIVWVATQTTFFQDVWAGMTEAIGTAWDWLWGNVLEPVFTAIGNAFDWLYNNVIRPVVFGIMLYIGIWAAIFTWLYQAVLEPVFKAIGSAFTWLYRNAIVPVGNAIGVAARGVGAAFSWVYGNVIKPVLGAFGAAFSWVYNNVVKPVSSFIGNAIKGVGSTIRSAFEGVAGFVGAAFRAVLGVVRAPINGIIGLVNGAIGSLNRLRVTIPDWVPMVGGQTWGLNLPRIPMLARGTNNAPDAFVAGENGPELITGARGATVRPYSATQDLLQRMGGKGGETNVYLQQTIMSTDPIVGARQAAREVSRYLGVA